MLNDKIKKIYQLKKKKLKSIKLTCQAHDINHVTRIVKENAKCNNKSCNLISNKK
jgi:hypothetical protein